MGKNLSIAAERALTLGLFGGGAGASELFGQNAVLFCQVLELLFQLPLSQPEILLLLVQAQLVLLDE